MKNLSEMGLLFNSFLTGYGLLTSAGLLGGLEAHRGIFINHLEVKKYPLPSRQIFLLQYV